MKKQYINHEIKELNVKDTQIVYDLLYPFFEESHYGDKGEFSKKNSIAYIYTFLYVDYATTYGLFVEGELSGLITIDINHEFHTRPMGYVTNFYTAPRVRGIGGARLLVEKAVNLCNSNKCLNIYAANTGIRNNKANNIFDNLFSKYGFVKMSNLLIKEC